jgi:hypothetical protein
MKRIITAVTLEGLLIALCLPASAHSGRQRQNATLRAFISASGKSLILTVTRLPNMIGITRVKMFFMPILQILTVMDKLNCFIAYYY